MNKELFMEVAKFTQGLTKEDIAMKELKTLEKEVRREMENTNQFNKVVEFYNTMTIEDIYGTVEYMDAEVVGVVGDDIEIGVADEDRVELMYGDSYINDGIRYTESIDLMYGTTLY